MHCFKGIMKLLCADTGDFRQERGLNENIFTVYPPQRSEFLHKTSVHFNMAYVQYA